MPQAPGRPRPELDPSPVAACHRGSVSARRGCKRIRQADPSSRPLPRTGASPSAARESRYSRPGSCNWQAKLRLPRGRASPTRGRATPAHNAMCDSEVSGVLPLVHHSSGSRLCRLFVHNRGARWGLNPGEVAIDSCGNNACSSATAVDTAQVPGQVASRSPSSSSWRTRESERGLSNEPVIMRVRRCC
jgi:hypothetical protein